MLFEISKLWSSLSKGGYVQMFIKGNLSTSVMIKAWKSFP